jgi:protein Tex
VTFEAWFHERHPRIPLAGAAAVLDLKKEGGTVPFIARYRKEQTGNLDEVQIQDVLDARERYERIVDRQAFIVATIEKQQKLTPELKERILATFDPRALEDLYLPFKVKKKSRAEKAREAGLQAFADWVWNCGHGTEQPLPGQTLELWAFTFRNEEKGVKDVPAVLEGTHDILTERLAEDAALRQQVRDAVFTKGVVHSARGDKAKPASKFEKYFDHHEGLTSLIDPRHSHRYLALRRGVSEGELTLAIGGARDDTEFEARLVLAFETTACSVADSPGAEVLRRAARTALKSHVMPAIETEAHRALKDVADDVATSVFAENLRGLLLASPFGPKAVVGVDPGIRTGCKIAVIDASGKFLASEVMQLQTEEGKAAAKKLLAGILERASIQAIAVGNGTAGRETEAFLRDAVKETGRATPVVMVSEAGASVYSASLLAREEFPDLDVTVRGAISIARRLQDPLAELVKVDPKSIGVGQYQHDVAPAALKRSLDQVVDSCVNQVGVNLNTASTHLLAHVSGIGPALAKAVVEHREGKGLFAARAALLDVPRFSSKTYELAAGFLRVPESAHPLDNTAVHPERYVLLDALATRLGKAVGDLIGEGASLVKADTALREQVGRFTFDDIVAELERPGRDPRAAFQVFAFRDDIHELKDLKPGMWCPGIVTNVTNFGAFVDIGVHQDGLVHVSQVADKFVKDPQEVVHPGLRVNVRILAVDLEKGQISLTMKSEAKKRPRGKPRDRGPRLVPKPITLAPGEIPPTRPLRPDRPRGPRPDRKPGPGGARSDARPDARSARPAPRPGSPPPSNRGSARPPSRPSTPTPPARAFNNPFAALAGLKDDLKKKS